MTWKHPIGDEHPFRAVYALAQAQNLHSLEIIDIYDGALIRLYHDELQLVFKRKGDPGSAMDRQRFDYWTHLPIEQTTPPQMLDEIKKHIESQALK